MSYTEGATFKMLPDYCSACGRPIDDCTSREFGIGPHCRKKYGYEDAYPIDDEKAKVVKGILETLSDMDVSDKAIDAVIKDDSRRAVNVLNHAVAIWTRDGQNTDDVLVCLAAMREMGYTALADKIGERIADVRVEVEDNRVKLDTPYDMEFVSLVKRISGRRWDKENKVWTVPVTERASAWKVLQQVYSGKLGIGPKGVFRI